MKNWIGFVAARYVYRGRRNSPSPVFSMLGIATGVLALTIIISVMNGFQIGFIESILEISSCHLRLEQYYADDDIAGNLRSLPGINSVLPFRELSALLRGKQTNPRGALIRGVPENSLELDSGLAAKLEIEDGYFNLSEAHNIVLGAELARLLYVRVGDELSLLSINGGIGGISGAIEEEGSSDLYTVTGIFRCGYYEYDLGWAFINIKTAEVISGDKVPPVLGIKLKNRFKDQKAAEEIKKLLNASGALKTFTVESWRDYNRAFFGALRTEKLVMFVLVGLIFIVVGLNIFQAQRRIVLERQEEIGLLRALGASDMAVRLVFILDGFIIGLSGAFLGIIPGLLIAFHITPFFTFLENFVNFLIAGINALSGLIGGIAETEEFALFSPRIFYIKEIPSKVIPHEAVLIFLFGFLSALVAAWFASGKVSSAKPAEVLRYE